MRVHFIFGVFLMFLAATAFGAGAAAAQEISAPKPETGTIVGTVLDVNDDLVGGATVDLEGRSPADHQRVETNSNGFFQFDEVNPGMPYHVTVSGKGFADWTSPTVILKPGQFQELTGIRLKVAEAVTTVHAVVSTEEIATEQLNLEVQQRILGFIPNFYVSYDPKAVPLTPKLKFKLALKTTTDPVTILGSAFLAGIDQAADTPDYEQGATGYFKRFGENYANGLTDIMIGGAILPSILHQDPRYFYQGTGTKKSRAFHALMNPFICRGDNGRKQPNYSALGGYLASGAISYTYYPASNRGADTVFQVFGTEVAADMAKSLLQEFVLRKFTSTGKKDHLTAKNEHN